MAVFSSTRERRLWLSVAVVVLAIYSTPGLARSAVGLLRAQGLLAPAFRRRSPPGGGNGGCCGSRHPTSRSGDRCCSGDRRRVLDAVRSHGYRRGTHSPCGVRHRERMHLRGGLGASGSWPPRAPALLAIAVAATIGTLDEVIQAFLPSRAFDTLDILVNVLASVVAVVAIVVLRWVRSRRGGQSVPPV